MSSYRSHLATAVCLCCTAAAPLSSFAQESIPAVVVTLNSADQSTTSLVGKVLAKTQDGRLLLEDRTGRLHQLKPDQFSDVTEHADRFSYLPPDELAARLLKQTGAGFAIHTTEHFVICSDASELYTKYCGRLLEKVWTQFQKLFQDSPVKLQPLSLKLPVLVFREAAVFQGFARQQHPDTDFSDVPGYYSVRDNQMLIKASSGDREFRTNSDVIRELKKHPRQVETIVHEAVHQLAYNTGLQVRYADNPMWLSEGLAVYFETASGRGSLIWSRPGEPNRIHLPGFRQAAFAAGRLRLPLPELLSSDAAFSSAEQLADAYAEGWALTLFLIRNRRAAFDQLMLRQQQRRPWRTVSGADRLAEIAEVTGRSVAEIETDLLRFMSTVRDRR